MKGRKPSEESMKLLKEGKKNCGCCAEILPLDDFYKDSRTTSGRQNACKVCHSKRTNKKTASDEPKGNKCQACGFECVHVCQLTVSQGQTICRNCQKLKEGRFELYKELIENGRMELKEDRFKSDRGLLGNGSV